MVNHPKRGKRTDWDIRGSYVAVYDPATKFFREWAVYATHGGTSVLPDVRRELTAKPFPEQPVMDIAGVRYSDRALATRILQVIAALANNDLADQHITIKLLPALIAICKYRPHFLLQRAGGGLTIGHIDVADDTGEARDALMARYPDIRAIAPVEFTPGATGDFASWQPMVPPASKRPSPRKEAPGKPIADIYVRVATSSASTGLARQEQACRDWCAQEGIEVRNVIKDTGRAFGDPRKKDAPEFRQAYDSWRKAYWEAKGEPLHADECDPAVAPIPPPDLLVMEDAARLCAGSVTDATALLMMLAGVGVQIKPINLRSNMDVSGPVTFHDDDGIGVRIGTDGMMILGRSEALGRKP